MKTSGKFVWITATMPCPAWFSLPCSCEEPLFPEPLMTSKYTRALISFGSVRCLKLILDGGALLLSRTQRDPNHIRSENKVKKTKRQRPEPGSTLLQQRKRWFWIENPTRLPTYSPVHREKKQPKLKQDYSLQRQNSRIKYEFSLSSN